MHFDIFNNDAFQVSQLSVAMVDLPGVPGRMAELGLFTEHPISTTSVSLEKVGQAIQLVKSQVRGGPGQSLVNQKRTLRSFNCIHLPQSDALMADEIQNVRAFGSESEVKTMQGVLNEKLGQMKLNLDVTIEWQRIGALKGQVVDADGTTVLHDMYQEFGVSQTVFDMHLETAGTDVKRKLVEVSRGIKRSLGGIPCRSIRVLCSPGFFDAFVGHDNVDRAFDSWMDGQFRRTQQRDMNGGGGFYFGNVYFEEFDFSAAGHDFIDDGVAYAFPEGVPGMFKTFFAPAPYMETVNTMGLPYYARQDVMDMNKGVDIEAQSNPLHLNTRPAAVWKLTV